MEAKHRVRIIGQEEITKAVYYIKLERQMDFIPGQLLALSDSPDSEPRYYSIASGINDDYWGILYNKVDDGWLTPWLSGLKKEDNLYCSAPFGEFVQKKGTMVWIATGTGVAPFHSMLRSGLVADNTIFIHGARQKEDFYFYDEFRSNMLKKYVSCSSQMKEPGYYHGRLSQYLQQDFTYPKSYYYLCGSSAMVVDIRDLLLSKGVEFDKIISEIYF